MEIIELKALHDFDNAYPLARQLNPAMTKARFKVLLKRMLAQGYRCIAAVEGKRYLGISGFWHGTRLWCGDFIDLDNVVVDEKARRRGVGKKLVRWIEKEARRLQCEQTGLDCYAASHDAHRFYMQEGYIIKGYHFIKRL